MKLKHQLRDPEQWLAYIEIPEHSSNRPVKLDYILAERLKTFIRSRDK